MSVRKDFDLSETLIGVLGALAENYGFDGSWLAWQYEKHVLVNGASPFRVTTSECAQTLKEGVDRVKFEIEFDHKNPNEIKWVRFDESRGDKTYMITQTSIIHMNEVSTCVLWLELPKGARGTDFDIAAAQSLLKVEVCCPEWQNSLPADPVTALERAKFYVAQGDITWMKSQLFVKDAKLSRVTGALACKKIEAASLSAALEVETDKLNAEIAKTSKLEEKNAELVAAMNAMTVNDLEGKLRNEKTAKKLQDDLQATKGEITKLHATVDELRIKFDAMEKITGQSSSDSASAISNKKRKLTVNYKTPTNKRKVESRTAPVGKAGPMYPNLRYTAVSFTATDDSPTPRTRSGRPVIAQSIQTPASMGYTRYHGHINRGSGRLASPIDVSWGSGGSDGDGPVSPSPFGVSSGSLLGDRASELIFSPNTGGYDDATSSSTLEVKVKSKSRDDDDDDSYQL